LSAVGVASLIRKGVSTPATQRPARLLAPGASAANVRPPPPAEKSSRRPVLCIAECWFKSSRAHCDMRPYPARVDEVECRLDLNLFKVHPAATPWSLPPAHHRG